MTSQTPQSVEFKVSRQRRISFSPSKVVIETPCIEELLNCQLKHQQSLEAK